ncbi:MAG: hypothetical protein K2O88_02095 [Paramuribaculum sp.]|nr:hypothetical protein [Paramuribaculum sp.]
MIIVSFTKEGPVKFVRYKDIRNLNRNEKIDFFSNPIQNMDWEVIPLNDDYSLRPIGDYDGELYSNFIPVTSTTEGKEGIFLRHCSGMKLSPTHLLVHFSKGQLSRRSRYIADDSHSYQEIKSRWYSGQAKPPSESKITQDVRRKLSSSARNASRYSYRPFLEAYFVCLIRSGR